MKLICNRCGKVLNQWTHLEDGTTVCFQCFVRHDLFNNQSLLDLFKKKLTSKLLKERQNDKKKEEENIKKKSK